MKDAQCNNAIEASKLKQALQHRSRGWRSGASRREVCAHSKTIRAASLRAPYILGAAYEGRAFANQEEF
jgi:hypothetical protein